jgi:ABC-2 type transport system ATP-binding protein
MNPVIELTGIHKLYGKNIRALNNVNIKVEKGQIFGLLGPNGAGKSTLVKVLLTVVRPSEGRGLLLGENLGHKPVLSKVGYLAEHYQFPFYLSGRQIIDLAGALTGVSKEDRLKRIPKLLETVSMTEAADRKVSEYSKGMKQRIGLAQALINEPELVILDEPTDGLDPLGRYDFRQIVTDLKNQGKTVLINSHLLSELEMVCDHVAIMVEGEVRKQGPIKELTKTHQYFEIHLADGEVMRIDVKEASEIQETIDRLRAENRIIREIKEVRTSLEDLFIETVGS